MNQENKELKDQITIEEAPKQKNDLFWKLAVLVMFIMVGAQTLLIYTMLERKNDGTPIAGNAQSDTVMLLPRPIQASTPPAVQHQRNQTPLSSPSCQNLSIPPLPKLNVNVNRQNGRAVIAQNTPTQRSPAFPRVPRSSLNSFPQGFSINIGPGMMGMNMRREMKRMERIMNSFFRMGGISRLHAAIPSPQGFGFSNQFAAHSPSITQNGGEYIVKLRIPGIDKSEVKAKVQGNMLTISGTKRLENNKQGKNGRSYMSSYSSFQNSFALPGPVKADKMKMDYDNDTLTIRIPKT